MNVGVSLGVGEGVRVAVVLGVGVVLGVYVVVGVPVFFLVLSEAYASHAHVSVDILQQKFSPPMIRLSEIVTCIVGIVVFSLIAYLGFLRAVDSFQSRDVMAGAIPLGHGTEPSDILKVEVSPAAVTLKPGEEVTLDVTIVRRPDFTQGVSIDVPLPHRPTEA